jgi:hypothetical protein
MRRVGKRTRAVGLGFTVATVAVLGTVGTVADAARPVVESPPSGPSWVVTLGDSAISGEAGSLGRQLQRVPVACRHRLERLLRQRHRHR